MPQQKQDQRKSDEPGSTGPTPPGKKIHHLDFHVDDFQSWRAGKDYEEIGRTVAGIAIASDAGDEAYIEKYSFIDRIVYEDGSVRKIIRGSGKIEDLPPVPAK